MGHAGAQIVAHLGGATRTDVSGDTAQWSRLRNGATVTGMNARVAVPVALLLSTFSCKQMEGSVPGWDDPVGPEDAAADADADPGDDAVADATPDADAGGDDGTKVAAAEPDGGDDGGAEPATAIG